MQAPKEKKEKKEKATRGSAFDRVKVVEKPKEEAVYAEGEDPFEVARQKREEKRKKAEETVSFEFRIAAQRARTPTPPKTTSNITTVKKKRVTTKINHQTQFDRKKNNMSAMEQFKGRPIGRD